MASGKVQPAFSHIRTSRCGLKSNRYFLVDVFGGVFFFAGVLFFTEPAVFFEVLAVFFVVALLLTVFTEGFGMTVPRDSGSFGFSSPPP